MRLLVLTCCVGLMIGCGDSHGSGAAGGGAGQGGQQSAGGKNASGGESQAGSANAQAGAPAEAGAAHGGSSGMPGGGTGMSGGGGAGTTGGAPSISSGGMGTLSGVCQGAFTEPSHQILTGMSPPSNLTVTGDELELFFNLSNVISSHKRASNGVLFPDAVPVAELNDVCGALVVGGMDVTLDGLRLYIACSDDSAGYLGPLRLATRPDRHSPFVLAPGSLGTVGNSISISKDELQLFAVTTPGAAGFALAYQRASVDAPFGPGELVMGLGGSFRYPEISPDGLDLFGVAGPDSGRLVVATRGAPSGSFSSPTSIGLPAPAVGHTQFGPTVSQSCALYFLSYGTPSAANTIDVVVH